jgi:hypothetical protein
MIENAFSALPDVKVMLYEPSGSPRPLDMPVATTRPAWTRARALFVLLMERYHAPAYSLGLLEIQKLAYFLQRAFATFESQKRITTADGATGDGMSIKMGCRSSSPRPTKSRNAKHR